MKKTTNIVIALVLCSISSLMTSFSLFGEFLSTSYIIEIGIAILFPIIAIIIIVKQFMKKSNNCKKKAETEKL